MAIVDPLCRSKGFLDPLVIQFKRDERINWDESFGRQSPLEIEIGFGLGEFLVRSAAENPQINFLGVEENWERIEKTLKKIQQDPALSNIRIIKADARDLFERFLDPESVNNIYCLFPCPWLKDRHEKHRLFSEDFLKLVNSRLKTGGLLKIVTDAKQYYDWIVGQLPSTGFVVEKNVTGAKYQTKFERKWIEHGQKEFFELNMVKEKHFPVQVKKGIIMQSYDIKEFDPQKFVFPDEKKEISVILKNMLFDAQKSKAMLHLIVSEGHLTQHFWVDIKKTGNAWKISKTDGQNIYLTEGLKKAVELVYEQAKRAI